jgi:hypothetical protein
LNEVNRYLRIIPESLLSTLKATRGFIAAKTFAEVVLTYLTNFRFTLGSDHPVCPRSASTDYEGISFISMAFQLPRRTLCAL